MILTCSFFRFVRLSHLSSILGTLFVVLCGISLSMTHVNLIDVGSPILFIGYADAALALGSFLATLYLTERILQRAEISTSFLVLLATQILPWCLCGPQALLAYGAVLAGMATLRPAYRRRIVTLCAFCVVMVLASTPLGGMLGPYGVATADAVDGAIASTGNSSGLGLQAELRYRVSHWGKVREGHELHNPSSYWALVSDAGASGKERYRSVQYRLETKAAEAIRLLFFPILGSFVCGWSYLRNPGSLAGWLRTSALVAAVPLSFCVAALGVFLFSPNGIKFELNRFVYPSAYVTLCLLWILLIAWQSTGGRWRKVAVGSILMISIFGSSLELAFQIHARLTGQQMRYGRVISEVLRAE